MGRETEDYASDIEGVQMRLIPAVATASHLWNKRPMLTPMEAAYLQDLANGASYSLKYSPYFVRKILRHLIDLRCAHIPYQLVEDREIDMVCVTDYGREACK